MIVESLLCSLCSFLGPCFMHRPQTVFATSTNPEFAFSETMSPGTGAERWLAEKMKDPEYAKAYQEALSRMDSES